MGTRKFEKIILSSAKSKDEIVAEALAQINKYEAKDPANDYICSVIHAYDSGDNAGDQYIIINEKLRVEYGLKGNAVASSHYSMSDIKAMIDAVDAKIPLDPAKEALLKEVESIEADIRAKEAQLPPKEKELRNLKQQKATIEQEIADLNSLIAQARAEGKSTTVLEASKAQREADLAAKNKQISTLEGQINEIKRQIPLLKEQAKNKQTQQESIKSFEPVYQIKNSPYGLKEIVLGEGGDTTDPAKAVAMGMKYKAFRIRIKGEVTGNLTIASPATYAEILFHYDADENKTAVLNGIVNVSNSRCRIIRLNLNNGLFIADRGSYVNILSSMSIIAPTDKAAINIGGGSIVFMDQTTGYPPRPWVLNSNTYGIYVDNYGQFIAGRSLEIQTKNTTHKVFCSRGGIATMTGTILSGDGADFNIALNTPTRIGLILR